MILFVKKARYVVRCREIFIMLVFFRFIDVLKGSLKSREAIDVDGERRKRRWDLRIILRKYLLKNIKFF